MKMTAFNLEPLCAVTRSIISLRLVRRGRRGPQKGQINNGIITQLFFFFPGDTLKLVKLLPAPKRSKQSCKQQLRLH